VTPGIGRGLEGKAFRNALVTRNPSSSCQTSPWKDFHPWEFDMHYDISSTKGSNYLWDEVLVTRPGGVPCLPSS